jgi:hypothetical protein
VQNRKVLRLAYTTLTDDLFMEILTAVHGNSAMTGCTARGDCVLLETANISFDGTVANRCGGGSCLFVNDSRRHGPHSTGRSNFNISTNCSSSDGASARNRVRVRRK